MPRSPTVTAAGRLWLELELRGRRPPRPRPGARRGTRASEPPDPDRAWQGTEAAWARPRPGIRADGRRRATPATPTRCSRADRRGRRDGRRGHHLAARAGAAGAATTTTATPGSATSATPARRSPRPGRIPLMDDAVRFVAGAAARATGRSSSPPTRPAAARCPTSATSGCPATPAASDIVGNWVNQQFQLDAFGEALLLFAAAARHDRLDADGWRAAEAAVAAIEQRWHEPTRRRHLGDRPGRLDPQPAHLRRRPARRSRRVDLAASRARAGSRSPTESSPTPRRTRCIPSGRWQRSPDDPTHRCRAAACRRSGVRSPPATRAPSPRCTLSSRSSTEDGYCYRFRPDERPLGEAEGAFLLCGFWMALALRQQGDHVSAARWFERNRAACGPPGLSRRSSTSTSTSCAATFRRHSSTRCCWSVR